MIFSLGSLLNGVAVSPIIVADEPKDFNSASNVAIQSKFLCASSTIIMFEYGKEVKRFEAGLSFNLDKDKIIKEIKNEIDEIQLRKFQ